MSNLNRRMDSNMGSCIAPVAERRRGFFCVDCSSLLAAIRLAPDEMSMSLRLSHVDHRRGPISRAANREDASEIRARHSESEVCRAYEGVFDRLLHRMCLQMWTIRKSDKKT